MRVYKFYLVRSFEERTLLSIKYNFDLKYLYDEAKDSCLILYGWTTDKDIRDEFKEMRSEEFILSSSEIFDEKNFHKFSVQYNMEQLDYRPLKYYDERKKKFKNKKVVMTLNEHITITDYTFETLGSYMEHSTTAPYALLKDKYVQVLDLFLYTSFHDIYNAENESIEDTASYNYSYDKSPLGISISKVLDSIDQLQLFSAIFSDLFK